jgi:hypothetical protein
VELVMAATDCGDAEMVLQTLVENLYDVRSFTLVVVAGQFAASSLLMLFWFRAGASRDRFYITAAANARQSLDAKACSRF